MIKSVPELRSLSTDVIKIAQNTDPNKTEGKRLLGLITDILDSMNDLVEKQGLSLSTSIDNKINNAKPDLTPYAKVTQLLTLTNYWSKSDSIPYTKLTGTPTIPTYDLSLYRKNSDSISYTDLSNKPVIVTDYTQLANKPNMSKLLWNQLSTIPVINTTVETNVLVTGNGNLTIDANPAIGTAFRLSGRGIFSTQTITLPVLSLTVNVYLGNTLITTGTSNSFLLGATNKTFSFGMDILVVGNNSIYTQGFLSYYAGSTDALSSIPLMKNSGAGNTTVDLTTNKDLKMTLTWGTASTSNQIQVKVANLEKLN